MPPAGAATRIKGASVGSEAEPVPEPDALLPYMPMRRVIQMQHKTEVRAGAVRFVSRREAPSEVGKTRPWHKNVCVVVAIPQYHATCSLSILISSEKQEIITASLPGLLLTFPCLANS